MNLYDQPCPKCNEKEFALSITSSCELRCSMIKCCECDFRFSAKCCEEELLEKFEKTFNSTHHDDDKTLPEATKRACQESTLLEALSYICLWESERIVKQAHKNLTDNTPANPSGAMWETCFTICLKSVMDNYETK